MEKKFELRVGVTGEYKEFHPRPLDDIRRDENPNEKPLGVCYTPSAQFEALIEEFGGDFRQALSIRAVNESMARGGAWTPSWDERSSFNPRGGD